jgi:hypothetical protein
MSTIIQAGDVRSIALGARVQKASAVLPATATQTIFTVAGGRVLMTSLLGEVTVVFDGTVNSLNVTFDPTVGAVGDLCAATVCTSDAAGTLYSITGVAADLLSAQKVTGTEVPTHVYVQSFQTRGIFLPAGVMGLKASATDTTGSTKWTMTYVAIDDGASVA